MGAVTPNRGIRRPMHHDRNKDIGVRPVATDHPDRPAIRAGRDLEPFHLHLLEPLAGIMGQVQAGAGADLQDVAARVGQ